MRKRSERWNLCSSALLQRFHLSYLLLFMGFLLMLAACAPAATTAPTSAPAATKAPAPTKAPEATKAAAATTAPAATAAPLPTPAGTASPTLGERRMLELEWPGALRLGESDLVRLSIVPYQGGYLVRAEFPEHDIQSQPVTVTRQAGYWLSGIARLDGVGFEIAPSGDQEQPLPLDQPVTWRWTLTPRAAGQQRLSISLALRWTPESPTAGLPRQASLYSRGLDIQVSSFLGLSRPQAMTVGFISLALGLGFGLGTLALRPAAARARLETLAPNPGLAIEPPPGLRLSGEESSLLQALFGRYARLALEHEFHSGYSGARTFLALPIRADGGADAHTIVKIGWREDIRREAENYEHFVQHSLPPMTARIQRAPVVLGPGARRAALQYTFIAEPGRPPISLRQVLLENPQDGPALIRRLFDTFGPGWWMQRRPASFRVSQEYDRRLPPHLALRPAAGAAAGGGLLNEETSPGSLDLAPGQVVRVGRFRQAEPRADGASYTLLGLPQPGQPALRLRWLDPRPPRRTVLARVVETRATLFARLTAGLDCLGLPDPLARLPEQLERMLNGTRSIIHGDLNLENVLTGPGGFVWLIDFAQTREGHPLFDFSYLAGEVIAHVLAPQFADPRGYLAALAAGRLELLSALEAVAARCLFNPTEPGEYTLSLYLSCLGALKHPNLSQHQKQLLYLTAAWAATRL